MTSVIDARATAWNDRGASAQSAPFDGIQSLYDAVHYDADIASRLGTGWVSGLLVTPGGGGVLHVADGEVKVNYVTRTLTSVPDVTVAANAALSPRRDSVRVRADGSVYIAQGVASGMPALAPLHRAAGVVDEVLVCEILVPPGFDDILDSYITFKCVPVTSDGGGQPAQGALIGGIENAVDGVTTIAGKVFDHVLGPAFELVARFTGGGVEQEDALGLWGFGGYYDATHAHFTIANLVGYATEDWTASHAGGGLLFQGTPRGSAGAGIEMGRWSPEGMQVSAVYNQTDAFTEDVHDFSGSLLNIRLDQVQTYLGGTSTGVPFSIASSYPRARINLEGTVYEKTNSGLQGQPPAFQHSIWYSDFPNALMTAAITDTTTPNQTVSVVTTEGFPTTGTVYGNFAYSTHDFILFTFTYTGLTAHTFTGVNFTSCHRIIILVSDTPVTAVPNRAVLRGGVPTSYGGKSVSIGQGFLNFPTLVVGGDTTFPVDGSLQGTGISGHNVPGFANNWAIGFVDACGGFGQGNFDATTTPILDNVQHVGFQALSGWGQGVRVRRRWGLEVEDTGGSTGGGQTGQKTILDGGGIDIATLNGSQTLNCTAGSNTTDLTASGLVTVKTSNGVGLILYTSKTTTALHGCEFQGGFGTIANGTYAFQGSAYVEEQIGVMVGRQHGQGYVSTDLTAFSTGINSYSFLTAIGSDGNFATDGNQYGLMVKATGVMTKPGDPDTITKWGIWNEAPFLQAGKTQFWADIDFVAPFGVHPVVDFTNATVKGVATGNEIDVTAFGARGDFDPTVENLNSGSPNFVTAGHLNDAGNIASLAANNAAFAAAWAQCKAQKKTLFIPPGDYALSPGILKTDTNDAGIRGAGIGLVTLWDIDPYGDPARPEGNVLVVQSITDRFYWQNNMKNPKDHVPYPAPSDDSQASWNLGMHGVPSITGIRIDGLFALNGAVGLRVGPGDNGYWEVESVRFRETDGANGVRGLTGGIGILWQNADVDNGDNAWSEENTWGPLTAVRKCSNGFVVDRGGPYPSNNARQSFGYNSIKHLYIQGGNPGFAVMNGAFLYNTDVTIRGNPGGTLVKVSGIADGSAQLFKGCWVWCRIDLQIEAFGGGCTVLDLDENCDWKTEGLIRGWGGANDTHIPDPRVFKHEPAGGFQIIKGPNVANVPGAPINVPEPGWREVPGYHQFTGDVSGGIARLLVDGDYINDINADFGPWFTRGTKVRWEDGGVAKYAYVRANATFDGALGTPGIGKTIIPLATHDQLKTAGGPVPSMPGFPDRGRVWFSYENPPDFPFWMNYTPPEADIIGFRTVAGVHKVPNPTWQYRVTGKECILNMRDQTNGESGPSGGDNPKYSAPVPIPCTSDATVAGETYRFPAAMVDKGVAVTAVSSAIITAGGARVVFGRAWSDIDGFTSTVGELKGVRFCQLRYPI